jgi:hypothetical protein
MMNSSLENISNNKNNNTQYRLSYMKEESLFYERMEDIIQASPPTQECKKKLHG